MADDDETVASDELARLSLGHEAGPPSPPPLPSIRCADVMATDITVSFTEAVKTLSPGELVKDDSFTLFESVAALEIMDPKMDSGCTKPGDEMEEAYDVCGPLLPEQVLGIMDQLLCHEMAWHLGYPLSQTLFTSLYAEALLMPDPSSILDAQFVRGADEDTSLHPMLYTLRAYCLGTLKACAHVNEKIKTEHYYEEEDFVTNTYSRSLLSRIPTCDIQQVLADTQELLALQSESAVTKDVAEALSSRIQLRHAFLTVTDRRQMADSKDDERDIWKKALAVLPEIRRTHCLGRSVDKAFSAKLQRKLASTMPPQPIVKLDFEDAFGHLSRLLSDGLEVTGVLDYTDSQCLQTFVSTFQAKKPQPLVYVRTLLQASLFCGNKILGSMSMRQLLDDDFSIVSMPASPFLDRANDDVEAVQDPRYTMAQQMEKFRQRAAQPLLNILRAACQNRCRVRRTLCHVLQDWENLQADAEDSDFALQQLESQRISKQLPSAAAALPDPGPLALSSWTYLYKLRQMECVVQLGFELGVYQDDELAGMYWYLQYLAKCRLQHLDRIQSILVGRNAHAARLRSGPNPDGAAQEHLQRSSAYCRLSLLDAAVTWELSDALSCLYIVLRRLGLIKTVPRPYSSDELRYELRMKPFVAIALPELPSFADFKKGSTQPAITSEALLKYGEEAVADAKKGYEALSKLSARESFSVGSHARWMASTKGALRSCIATGIAISSLQKALQRCPDGGDLGISVNVPTSDRAYHEWWIVPQLGMKAT